MTTIRVSRIAGPISVLGPGTRVVLWVQGCTIGCAGCASTDTWADDGGSPREIPELADELLELARRTDATGLTISGGEPFQQAEAVTELVAAVRAGWTGAAPDVLVFTGYAAAAAARRSPGLWGAADIIVAGPYRADRPSEHPLLGSDNQTIEVLTGLGAERLAAAAVAQRPLQVGVRDGDLVVVGMPDPGDLDRLRAALADRGIRLRDVSWSRAGAAGEA